MSASKNTIFSMMYKALLALLGFANSVLLARTLSKETRLEFQFAGSVNQTGMTYVGGYTNYYSFAIPRNPHDTARVVQMGNLFMFALSLIVWLFLLAATVLPVPWLHLPRPWFWALACMPLTFVFGYGSRILQSTNQITWLNRANTAQPLLFTLFTLALFLVRRDYSDNTLVTAAYILWVASFAIAVAFTLAVAYRRLGVKHVARLAFNKVHWLGTMRYGGWSSVAQVVNIVNYRMDFWFVTAYLPTRVASVYGIAVVASEVLLNVSGSIASVVFTRMTAGNTKDAMDVTEFSSRQTILSSTIVALGMCVVFPILIPLAYGSTYAGAVLPFFILLPGLVVKAASNIVIQYATNSLGQPKTSIWMNGVSGIINALLCVALMPTLGMIGAALASTSSYVLSFVVYVYWYRKVTKKNPSGLYVIRREDLAPYVRLIRAAWRRVRRVRG